MAAVGIWGRGGTWDKGDVGTWEETGGKGMQGDVPMGPRVAEGHDDTGGVGDNGEVTAGGDTRVRPCAAQSYPRAACGLQAERSLL